MLIVISPAKKLDFTTRSILEAYTQPAHLLDARRLVKTLRNYSAQELSALMNISAQLGELNFQRYQDWKTPFTPANAKQALLALNGDVYVGLNAQDFSPNDFSFAQQSLRILSGLYGVLRPLDLMQPYRLEMGTKLETDKARTLYAFWDDKIAETLNAQLDQQKEKTLVNLASNEYFKSVNTKQIKCDIITPVFKEKRDGKYRVIGLLAKRARGMMSRYVIKNRLQQSSDIKDFNLEGYRYKEALSKANEWVFTRDP